MSTKPPVRGIAIWGPLAIIVLTIAGAIGGVYWFQRSTSSRVEASVPGPSASPDSAAPPAALPTSPTAPASTAPTPDALDTLWQQRLPDRHGVMIALAQYRGRPLVLNFWASWCGPCVREMPRLGQLARAYAGRQVSMVGIGVDSAANIAQFLQKVPVDYPIVVAGFPWADLARRFGDSMGALPYTVVIDAQGRVRYTHLGEVDDGELTQVLDQITRPQLKPT